MTRRKGAMKPEERLALEMDKLAAGVFGHPAACREVLDVSSNPTLEEIADAVHRAIHVFKREMTEASERCLIMSLTAASVLVKLLRK